MNRAMAIQDDGTAVGVDLATGLENAALAAVIAPAERLSDQRAGAIAVRAAAAAAARVDADRLEVVRRRDMPPAVLHMSERGRLRVLPVSVTVSHRLGRAVAAACPGQVRLGIDVECRGAVPPGLERLYLAPSERALLRHHAPEALWALKEAAWKALRLDDAAPFHALELICDDEGTLRALSSPSGVVAASAKLWEPWPRFIAALVWLP